MAPAAVLWDADGVLQVLPSFDELWPFLPDATRDAVLADTFGSDHREILTGAVDMERRVEDVIERHGLGEQRDAILAVWHDLRPVEQARALLARIRSSGITCVLATNQDSLREKHMRPVYEPLLDRLYFSSAMGAKKPEPAYFIAIADDLGVDLSELVFVDDSEVNVAGAAEIGVQAVRWHFSLGIERLREALAGTGVLP
jgi:putative hydrolase of the HAD superfamily